MIDMRDRMGQVTQIFSHSYQFNTIAPLPDVYALHQNYPNPFNPITQIRYGIPEASVVNIIVYDVMGHEVTSLVNQRQDAGYHVISWDATNSLGDPVSAGMYFYSIRAGDFMETRKMILLK